MSGSTEHVAARRRMPIDLLFAAMGVALTEAERLPRRRRNPHPQPPQYPHTPERARRPRRP